MTAIQSPWADRSIVDDPYPFYAWLRETAPVWQVPGTRTFFVAPWELVAEAVARVDDFSSNLTAVLIAGYDGDATEFDMTPLGSGDQRARDRRRPRPRRRSASSSRRTSPWVTWRCSRRASTR